MPGLLYAIRRYARVGEVSEAEAVALFEARRRELLADELLPEAFPPARLDPSVIGMRVAVIGAGFAGLTAAWFLSLCGAAVTVYEASGRVGGRVRTLTDFVPGRVVEAGAELIGTNHTYWWILAARFGLLPLMPLTREDDYDDDLAVRLELDGHVLTDAELEQLAEDLAGVFDVLGAEARGIHRSAPWTSPDAAALDARSVGARLDELAPAGTFLRGALELLIDNDNCAPVYQQSYLGLLTLISAGRWGSNMRGYWELTETHRCQHGNQALADRIAARLGAAVRLDSPVTAVAIEADGVAVTADGATEEYAHAILAVPPTVWDGITVTPAFDRAGRTISHGPAVKYLARYPTPFWLDQGLAPSARSDRIGSIWESTDRQDTGPGAGLSAYSGGSYVLPDAASYATELQRLYPKAPDDARLVDWPSMPWIKTGNSVPAPGEVTTVARRLTEPHAGRLHFAGEQTTVGFSGYMEGALRSGARAAGAIMRTRLRAAGPPAAPPPRLPELRAYSPLGPAATAGPAARADHVAHVRTRTVLDPAPFAADQTLARWVVDDPAGTDDALRVVSAFWPGHGVVGPDGMARVQLHPGLATRLRDLFAVPPPVLATYGPIDPVPFPAELAGGEVLGRLDGPELVLGFLDDQGFWLDPVAVLTRLAELGLLVDCPLVPIDGQSRQVNTAGPDPIAPGEPYLVLRAGAAGAAVHHPPAPLPVDHFSFVAEQEVLVGVGNAPGPGPYELVVEDITGLEYRTAATNPLVRAMPHAVAEGAGQPFMAATGLPPQNLKRKSRKPGVPLTYRLEVTGAGPVPLGTTIGQSMRDVVRQEYTAVPVPEPVHLDQPVLPAVARHFALAQFTQWNNFGATAVVADLDQQAHVAEYLRRRYAARLADRNRTDPDSIPDTVTSYDLAVTSAWRNPQRNRNAGGKDNSNHMYGRALDLAPVGAGRAPDRPAPGQVVVPGPRAVVLRLLLEAGRDFVEELVALNGRSTIDRTELLVEKQITGETTYLLWSYKLQADGTLESAVGTGYAGGVGTAAAPSLDVATELATHIHVGWRPRRVERPLVLPPIPDYDVVPPEARGTYRNLVLLATEDDSVQTADRSPYDHVAESLRAHLEKVDPHVTAEVVPVADAAQWLAACAAWDPDSDLSIRHLVHVGPVRPGALTLTRLPAGTPARTDPAVLRRLSGLYDVTLFDAGTADDGSDEMPVGADVATTVDTGEIRVSNLRFLPREAAERLRRAAADVQAVLLVGAGEADTGSGPSFARDLATLLRVPVWGGGGPAEVLAPDPDGTWRRRDDLRRGGPPPPEQPVVLAPSGAGATAYLDLEYRDPDAVDLLAVYRQLLRRFDPGPLR